MSIVDRDTLLGLLEPQTVRLCAGQVLLREGEVSGRMFMLEEGELEVLRDAADGRMLLIGTVAPGQLVGEISLLDGSPHTATVRARTECRLMEVSRELLEGFEPQRSTPLEYLLREMARSISGHLRGASDATVEVLELRQSMASFLVSLLMGLAAYAVVMRILAAQHAPLRTTLVFTVPILTVMTAMGVVWARRSRMSARIFGLSWEGAAAHAREALLWTLPVLGLLTALKWGLCRWVPELAGATVFTPRITAASIVVSVVYLALVPLQEFVARGAIQGPLFEFLVGSERRRHLQAVVVSNTLFAVSHLHLTLAYGIAAFLGGLLWGALLARQRSLVGPIVSHALVGAYALEGLGFGRILRSIH